MTSAAALPALSYLPIEIRSYLPTGWKMPEDGGGAWDAAKGVWSTRLTDGADFDWPLAVKASDAAKHGRLEALRLAVDRVFRDRLGKPTRGLGLG